MIQSVMGWFSCLGRQKPNPHKTYPRTALKRPTAEPPSPTFNLPRKAPPVPEPELLKLERRETKDRLRDTKPDKGKGRACPRLPPRPIPNVPVSVSDQAHPPEKDPEAPSRGGSDSSSSHYSSLYG